MSLLRLSNLLLLHIISQIDDNIDTICLLLTCKQLYRNGSVRRSTTFKGIEAITDKGQISKQFQATATRFKLNTFKDILENSISDQYVILEEFNDYPQWIQQRITKYRADTSNITTFLMTYYVPSSLQILYNDVPSIETLFINNTHIVVDLGSISLLPRLERLSVHSVKEVKLGQHTTLKSMKLKVDTRCTLYDLGLTRFVSLTDLSFKNQFVSSMGPGLLPISLTSLTLKLNKTPPRDTFHSLKSLVKLKITLENVPKGEVEEEQQAIIDLEHLPNLETFKLTDNKSYKKGKKYSIEMIVPPSIKILTIWSDWAQVPSQCVMPLLETIDVYKASVSLPRGLEKLTYWSLDPSCHLMTFPSNYPPNLETIDLLDIESNELVIDNIPPPVTNLSIPLKRSGKLWSDYSITSKLTKAIVSQQQQWLPLNTTHLTCKLWVVSPKFVFRLDEVINHTNVRDLSIIIDDFSHVPFPTYQFSIQRLDKDNNNVLVLEKLTMTGGIITQRRISKNQQQQQQQDQQTQYHPIYLHFDLGVVTTTTSYIEFGLDGNLCVKSATGTIIGCMDTQHYSIK
ncbi:hypothetical protein DFA_06310 [Cavenderia fasciculata]|uniref:FNIP repeat-containing protein n=1 Tax=Cavenderia fasciculata TaxID=261658 RepID=F4PKP0_CACFS|nr:uncharacterized protein DFA_06310 [Cavenderia fasciculata]EGG24164.1 hypothetical protein DFA_06310 [Cavenderia fasciculata]|eukprot:XP_004362015.1 hypothetical protein DFA_06310 [Cavenderia fasciculata]